MKISKYILPLATAAMLAPTFGACNDDMSQIGDSLTKDEIVISIDSVGFKLGGKSIAAPAIDARSTTNMIGNIDVAGYGKLKCSFVSRLFSVASLNIPDSITADSVCALKMIVNIQRNTATGDTLSPQVLRLYELTKQLPDSITNQFDPTGYYSSSSLLGQKSYVVSAIGLKDSAFKALSTLPIAIDLPLSKGKEIFNEYRNNPSTFQWPASMAKYFPGIYAENGFGSGCVANVTSVQTRLYWHNKARKVNYNDSTGTYYTWVQNTDSVAIFTTAPEVLSSNNISLQPDAAVDAKIAAGYAMLQSPAGYNVRIKFPAQEIIDAYRSQSSRLATINNLTLSIPIETFENDYGISLPPYLLMVKTSELEEFFAKNKVPDDKTSFWAAYSSKEKGFNFTSMRQYISDLMKSGEPVKEEDMEFTLVPVSITTETSTNTSAAHTYVTACVPYLLRPTLCRLKLEDAKIKFTFSSQQIL